MVARMLDPNAMGMPENVGQNDIFIGLLDQMGAILTGFDLTDCLADICDALLHPISMGPERQHADPQRKPPAEHGGREVYVVLGVDALEKLPVERVQLLVAPPVILQSKSGHRQLRLGQNLYAGRTAQFLGGPLGEIQLLVEVASKSTDAVKLDRQQNP